MSDEMITNLSGTGWLRMSAEQRGRVETAREQLRAEAITNHFNGRSSAFGAFGQGFDKGWTACANQIAAQLELSAAEYAGAGFDPVTVKVLRMAAAEIRRTFGGAE